MIFGKKKNAPVNMPHHIAIIMDGNGRWAKKRGLPRKAGHTQGARVFKARVDDLVELGVECATFYTFSTENWKRPKDEVDALMKLFDSYLDDIKSMAQKNIRLSFIGDLSVFSPSLREKMNDAMDESAKNTGLKLNIALNYGGRAEIINAVNSWNNSRSLQNKNNKDELTEEVLSEFLYTRGLPEVDLMIRPSGEKRISNFLIWQMAYAEFVFMDVLWPDFSRKHLLLALEEYSSRERRFGGI